MAKRTSLTDRERRPIDALFTPSTESENMQTSNHKNISQNKQNDIKTKEEYIRKTYYLTQPLIDSLAVYSTFEKLDISEIVREALEKYIPEKYKEMAKNITNK